MFTHPLLGHVVQRRSCLIEQQDIWMLHQCPCQQDALPLTTRNAMSILANGSHQSLGHVRYVLIERYQFDRFPHLVV